METCLVIEDSDNVRHVTCQLIERAGSRTLQAASCEDGVDVLQAARPDIVFLDWDLPGLGALEFLKGLAGLPETERPPVVLCAMENDAQQFALARAAGAAYHIMKPYDGRDVTAVLGEIRKNRGTAGQEPNLRTAS